jgi:hypothetical protein
MRLGEWGGEQALGKRKEIQDATLKRGVYKDFP